VLKEPWEREREREKKGIHSEQREVTRAEMEASLIIPQFPV